MGAKSFIDLGDNDLFAGKDDLRSSDILVRCCGRRSQKALLPEKNDPYYYS